MKTEILAPAGDKASFYAAVNAGADAVACAAVLHYKKETVTELKEDIRAGGVEVRQV